MYFIRRQLLHLKNDLFAQYSEFVANKHIEKWTFFSSSPQGNQQQACGRRITSNCLLKGDKNFIHIVSLPKK